MTAEDPLWGTFATFSIRNIISSAIKTQKTRRVLRCWDSRPSEAPFRTCCRCPLPLCDKRKICEHKYWTRCLEAVRVDQWEQADRWASAPGGSCPARQDLPIFRWSLARCWSRTAKIFLKKNDEKMRRREKKEKTSTVFWNGKTNKEHMKLIKQSGRQWQED